MMSFHARPHWIDGFAVSASALCLVHCLALPFLAVGLPAAGLLVEHHEAVHWALLVLAVPLGLIALGRGRRSAGPWPSRIGLAGFALMAAAVGLWHDRPAETWGTVAGVILVAAAHIANWRAIRRRA